MMLTLKDFKKRKTAPKPRQPKAADARRIVDRMVSAYMSWVKDNPGGTP